MTKHKTDDYTLSAVQYYLNNNNQDGYQNTCNIFGCKKSTQRFVNFFWSKNPMSFGMKSGAKDGGDGMGSK